MKVELELWHLIVLLTTVVGAFWALAQMLIAASTKNVSDKFDAISALIQGQSQMLTNQSEDMRRIERDLMGLKAELPKDYVRREDYTQQIATIMIKIDHATSLMQLAVRDAYTQAFKVANGNKDMP